MEYINMSEPMIQIKKPDGTFVKVTMSEFKKMQAEKKSPLSQSGQLAATSNSSVISKPATVSVAPVVMPQSPDQIMGKTTVQIKEKQPVPPADQKLNRNDAKSLLEEKVLPKNQSGLTSQKRESQVEEVVRRLGFSVSPDLQGRMKSLVLAKLKDIKSAEEIKEVLVKPVKNGGLGLTDVQAEKVVQVCQRIGVSENLDDGKKTEPPVLKGKTPSMSLMVEPPELPMVIPTYNTVATKNTTLHAAPSKEEKEKIVSKILHESIAQEPIFKISSQPVTKQTMQDISVSEEEMGPVEELKSMTLEDFRRISSNPEEAAKRVLQKMLNLKEESFVWYLDGVAAFRNSPLYVEYMSNICRSLSERKTVANVLASQNGIKLSEVVAIVEMEKDV